MNWIHQISSNEALHNKLSSFLTDYGLSGLEQALDLYTDMQQDYICKTKNSTTRIKLSYIYYLEIHGHNIIAHTTQGQYRKYGTLTTELKSLPNHGFVKCNQSCIVSLAKVTGISGDQLILLNGEKLHISRSCAPKVIMAFHNFTRK